MVWKLIFTVSKIRNANDFLTDDINGDGEAGYYFDGNQWLPEPNVDEADENIPQKRELSIFPIIPTIGFSIEF